MKTKSKGIVERFCENLGRQNFVTKYLDYLTNYLFPTTEFAYAKAGAIVPKTKIFRDQTEDLTARQKPLMMARPPGGLENFHGNSPLKPHEKHGFEVPGALDWLADLLIPGRHVSEHEREKRRGRASQTHSAGPCANPKYRGMHGRPCSAAGGSDNVCPKGTLSGWWWSYEVPKLGRIYYVDCCGGASASDVWCNWTSENNWCLGYGSAAAANVTDYNCTLAILEADMNVVQSGSTYVVSGADPAP